MKDKNTKKIVLALRWTIIIVTSYLILFGRGTFTRFDWGYAFILLFISSNLILVFLPRAWFSNPKLFYSLVVLDTGIVSFGMYLSEKVATDFYLVFFLILIFASMSQNYMLLMIISAITASIYGVLLSVWGLFSSEHVVSYTLRIAFLFIMASFYGYLVQTFSREKQQQLTISEEKYRGLFENSNDGIIILRNPQFLIADVNREVERLIGYKKGELLQRRFIDLFRSTEEGKALGFLEEVLGKGEGRTDAISLLRKDGTPLEVDLSAKRIDLEDESFYQVIFRDLTEQKKLEKKIRQAKMNLEAIFDGIRNQLSLQSPHYDILRVNRSVIEKYHTTYTELIGRKCYEAYYGRPYPCETCPVAVTIKTKQPSSSILKISETHTTLRISSYPILDEKSDLVSIIEDVQDITEEEQLQEQLIQSEKLAGIGILASGVAHEINNPLSGIIGIAEIALDEEDSSEHKTYLGDILSCAQRINQIVKGLRSYSRVAKQEEQSRINVNEVLEESLKMVQLAIKTTKIKVIRQYKCTEEIKANAGEIQQVFTNLITNAFQAINEKEGVLTLSTRSLHDLIEVTVGDSGIGIPQEDLKKIFDPFFTTKKPGEGTGLGLNVVYRIVVKYEGTIDIESKKGVGTTFTIKFPFRRDE